MKKIMVTLLGALFISAAAFSQDKEKNAGQELKQAGKSTGKAVKKSAKYVGRKTGRAGAKTAAWVKDKPLKNEKGPDGETVYVNEYGQKYYVNKDVRRVYID